MSDNDMELALRVTGDASGAVSAVSQTTAAMDRLPETINISQASLDRLSGSLDSIVKQHGALADSSSKAEDGVKRVGGAASQASKEGGELNSVGGDMARMFSSIGLQSGEAASRIGALAGALDSLKTAAPAIIAAVATGIAAVSGFEFIRSAISAASDLQNSMTRLGAVVTAQGGNWKLLSASVKEYVDAQVASTTYTDTAVINSLERLVASGMSVKDSMTTVRVTEDLAAGSGRSLEEATNALIEAEHGRLVGLEAMGILTKQQVKDGMSFDQVLQQIESHMGGAALAATSTYSGALSQLSATWEKLLEDVGTPFLGALAKVVAGFSDVVRVVDQDLQPTLDLFADWAKSEGPNIAQAFGHITDDAQDMVTYFQGDVFPEIAALWTAFGNLSDAVSGADKAAGQHSGWDDLRDAIKDVSDMISFTLGLLTEAVNKMADLAKWQQNLPFGVREVVGMLPPFALIPPAAPGMNAAQTLPPDNASGGFAWMQAHNANAARDARASTSTDYNPELGGPAEKKPKAATPTYDAGPDVTANYHDQSDALQQLNEWLSQLPKSVEGYNEALQKLAPLIADDTQKQTQLGAELDNARNRLTVAADDYNTYKDSLQGVTKLTVAQQEALKQYKDAYDAAQKSVDTLSTSYDKNRTELQGLTKDQVAARDALAKLSSDWAKFVSDSGAKTQEDLDTFKMTESQKVAYYSQKLSEMAQLDTTNIAERERLYSSYEQAIVADVKQEFQAEQQFQNEAAQRMASFLDTIVVEHKSMADALKSVYQDIEKYFIDMLAQMLARALMALPIFQAILGLGGGGGGGIPGIGSLIPTGPGGLLGWGGSSTTGGPNTTTIPGSAGSAPALAPLLSSPMIANATRAAMSQSGGGGSVGSGSYDFGGGGGGGPSFGGGASPDFGFGGAAGGSGFSFAGGGGGGIGSPDFTNLPQPSAGAANPTSSGGASGGTLTGGGFAFGPNAGGAGPGLIAGLLGRGGLLGSLGMAGVAGMAVGDLAFGGKGYSALGGMLGALGMEGAVGLTGAAFAGGFAPAILASLATPLGWGLLIGAALLGAFGGSLFGDHFSAADEPDISQTDAWGQANADMQGMTAANPMNANGKQFVMDSQTSSATGGRGWNIMMEKFVQQYRGNLSTLPYTLQAAFPNIEQLWGGATDKQFFNPDGKDGYLDVGSGKRALWSDFWGVITQYGQSISSLMQNQTPTEMYVTNVDGLMRSIGSGTPTPGGSDSPFTMGSLGGGSGSNSVASGGPGRIGASLAQRLSQSIAINVNVNNSSTLTDTANLSRALRDAFGTTLPSALEDLNVR